MQHKYTREINGTKTIDRCEHGTITMINDDGYVSWYTCPQCKIKDDIEAKAKVEKDLAFYQATGKVY